MPAWVIRQHKSTANYPKIENSHSKVTSTTEYFQICSTDPVKWAKSALQKWSGGESHLSKEHNISKKGASIRLPNPYIPLSPHSKNDTIYPRDYPPTHTHALPANRVGGELHKITIAFLHQTNTQWQKATVTPGDFTHFPEQKRKVNILKKIKLLESNEWIPSLIPNHGNDPLKLCRAEPWLG